MADPGAAPASPPASTPPRGRGIPPRTMAVVVGVVLLAIVAWAIFGRGGVRRSDLDLLPPNSPFVLVVDVGQLYDSELGTTIRDAFTGPYGELEKDMEKDVGFGPERVSHVLLGGEMSAGMPSIVVILKDALGDDEIERVVRVARVNPQPREVQGTRVWGGEDDRMAMALVRSNVLLFGVPGDVEAALRGHGKRGRTVELLLDEGGLDASLAMVFDWTAAGPVRKQLERQMREVAPLVFKHAGPIVARVDVDDGVTAKVKLLDARGERVRASYAVEVDGEFLQELITDIGRMIPQPRARRTWDEPPPVEWDRAAPAPETAPARGDR